MKKEYLGKKRIRILEIRGGGEACFIPKGSVAVRMPNSNEFWGAFAPRNVLKIVSFPGKQERRNWLFCEKCVANSGRIIISKLIRGSNRRLLKIACSCGKEWYEQKECV
jgi:hypothetical protein